MCSKEKKTVVHITTVHHPLDPRIYYKQCQSLQRAGYDVTLLAPDAEKVIPSSIVNIKSINRRNNRLLRIGISTLEAYWKARKLKADIYQIHDPELLPVAWLLKKKSNVVIYDIHEDYETAMMEREYLPKPVRRFCAKAYRLVERLFSRKLELCLAEKYYREKYPNGKCILNYPLVNEKLVHHNRTDKPIEDKLLYTGNVRVDRGAFHHAKLPLVDENISVHLIGQCPGNLAEQMEHLAGEAKDRLHMEGVDRYVPKTVIDECYVKHSWLAGIALFPPSDHFKKKELTKFFEYMSAGIPILCSDFPAWKAFVEKHRCGMAVNPEDEQEIKAAIDYLRNNEQEALKMGENGRRAVLETLNWEVEEQKLVEWYDTLWRKNEKTS
ncbi:glycosyltransferase [Halalkalibacterium halodurans]|uniref:Glycosyltransferase (Biosynthesis of lipopolisaccharide O antigen) n=1 Tax=Halalkalibacterium halodurans (strain ATCC BAA-125 / DSM 18197 / FERM 7344 / JCM 9153 / C-125) TaxID=272558 RepID=Q9K6R5_HALH5|nr:glycosyltransferase [Halalkalibacterium halodurans]MDY7224136.1 glycosyltransferase [Halalkalibacterium halodurans]MDY7243421.1 glycosyltransferase [Halalkalibacterium halodurans]MED4174010.1 glycosyltransferase [Halalkalibacterium halodurans]BAB07381.1 glycosyltransferase (biosynthesis of lipopolisaccharide O antigen) [Halalkalibacterium halodurans C-125]